MSESTGRQMPAETIDTLARAVFEQGARYGFNRLDQVRLASALLSLCNEDQPADGVIHVTDFPRSNVPAIDEGACLPLSTDRLSIEHFDETVHRPHLDHWLRDAFGRNFLLTCGSPQGRDLDAVLARRENVLAMVSTKNRDPIGVVAYFDRNVQHRRAEFRILIGKSSGHRCGFGHEAAAAWLGFGLSALGLQKVYCHHLEGDVRSASMLERLGFEVEGLLKQEAVINWSRENILRWGYISHCTG